MRVLNMQLGWLAFSRQKFVSSIDQDHSFHSFQPHTHLWHLRFFTPIVNDDVPVKIVQNWPEIHPFCAIQSAKWDDDRQACGDGGITPDFPNTSLDLLHGVLTPCFPITATPHVFDYKCSPMVCSLLFDYVLNVFNRSKRKVHRFIVLSMYTTLRATHCK